MKSVYTKACTRTYFLATLSQHEVTI